MPSRKRLITIKAPNSLKKYGYHVDNSALSRQRALAKAVLAYGYSSVMKKVNALYVFSMNRQPTNAKKYRTDKLWLQSHRTKFEKIKKSVAVKRTRSRNRSSRTSRKSRKRSSRRSKRVSRKRSVSRRKSRRRKSR